MGKKAFLVSTTFMSRVVVDVDDNGEIINWNNLVSQVEKSIRDAVSNNETDENIDTFFPDEECPYSPEEDNC